ncbi:MAG: NAD(P)-dependent oxidoreductase [Pseudomonadota bacterium]
MKKVGFVGVGVMGGHMARNVLKAEFPVTVYDTRASAVKSLQDAGARAAGSCEEVGKDADIVIVMVADAAQVTDAVFGDKGLSSGMRKGSTLVIMSTIEPTVVKRVAEDLKGRGVHVVDAPVYRGAPAAEAGTLGILVGGEQAVLDDCREVLETMGDVYHCGDVGTGEVVKLVNNFIIINHTLLLSEALVTGVKYGMKPERLIELLKAGSANSWILGYWSDMVMNRKFTPPLFDFKMALKDVGLAINTAKELGVPMPVGTLCHQVFQLASANGRDKLDYTAAVTWLEDIAGVKVIAGTAADA